MLLIRNKKLLRRIINTQKIAHNAFSIIVASLVFTAGAASAATTYAMKDIGINPKAISSNGKVLGSLYKVYDNGTLTDIHLMTSPALLSEGFDINASGQVVGYGSSTGRGFIRNPDGTFITVGPSLDPDFGPAAAFAINDAGQVAGKLSSLKTACIQHSYLGSTTSPELIDIGHLGGDRTQVIDINATGDLVGSSSVKMEGFSCPLIPNYHAFVFSKAGGIQDLHSPTMVGNSSAANKINNIGFVVGNFANGLTVPDISGYYPNGFPIRNAVIWNLSAGTYQALGNQSMESDLLAINDKGIAVGYERGIVNTYVTMAGKAVLVEPNGTALIDLNTLVPSLPSGWSLTRAVDINNAGQIIALANDVSGIAHGVLLTPTGITPPPPPVGTVPAAPSNLTVIASLKRIDLSWKDNANNEQTYVIERCKGSGCTNFTVITTTAANVTSFNNTGLSSKTSYSYRVKATNTTGSSTYSNISTVKTL